MPPRKTINGISYFRLCRDSDIAAYASKGFQLQLDAGPVAVLVVHKHDQLFCYLNRCPHTGINLEWMPDQFLDITGELIQCATHGALFSIKTGLCIRGPCLGQYLTRVECVKDGEEVFVAL